MNIVRKKIILVRRNSFVAMRGRYFDAKAEVTNEVSGESAITRFRVELLSIMSWKMN